MAGDGRVLDAGDRPATVQRLLAQFPEANRAEAIHLALRALRARVEPDRVLACELGWELHTQGDWSQLRGDAGRPYESRVGKPRRFASASCSSPPPPRGVTRGRGDPCRRDRADVGRRR